MVNGFAAPSRTSALYNPMGWMTLVSEASAGGSAFGSTYLYHRPNDPRGAVPDPFGRPAEILAADGKKTQLAYEGARVARRSQRVQQQVQTRSGATMVWSTAEVWVTTVELHDGLGRLREIKDPNGTRTTYAYDPGGRLVTVTTRSGNKAQTRTFSYDGRGFRFRENPAESGAITYRYDARGNAISKGTPTGTIFFGYDAAGRLTKVTTPDGKLREYVYGKVGNLTGRLITSKAYNYRATGICTEYMVQLDYRYDANGGRLSAADTTLFQSGSQQEKWTQSYGYDGAGRVTQISYPSCLAGCAAASRSVGTTYTYGRPTSIPGFASSITYGENGTLSKIEHANGVGFTSGLDPKGMARPGSLRADRVTASGAAPVWPQESYTFDGAGNVKQIGAKSFTYDNLSRLTSALMPTASGQPYQEYAYDAFGNLTRLYRGTSKGNATYVDYQTSPSTNRLTGASYDGSGSMAAFQGTAYTWDVLQQLAKVDATAAGSEAWTHVYDAAGERVWSWRTSSTRVDAYALRGPGGKVLSLFTKIPGSPAPTYSWKDYVYRGGQLLGAKMSDGTVRHFDVDHLGSVRLETDATGTIAYRELWPYGEEATPLSGDERMKFTGHERDLGVLTSAADDLDYMHARYYKPLMGRFLSIDPSPRSISLNRPASWNRYTYVLGNPLKFIDPRGELWFNFNGTWTYLKGVDQIYQESTDKDGGLVITVIAGREMFLTFNGGTLTLYRKDGSTRTFDAVSGKLDKNGRTRPGLQRVAGRGPIPEGTYHFNPALIQHFGDLDPAQKAASLFRRGEWPGGPFAWGRQRVQLTPDPSTNTYGRGGFFIHGGVAPGSAGCIDLCDQAADFFNALDSSGDEIPVEVDYP